MIPAQNWLAGTTRNHGEVKFLAVLNAFLTLPDRCSRPSSLLPRQVMRRGIPTTTTLFVRAMLVWA